MEFGPPWLHTVIGLKVGDWRLHKKTILHLFLGIVLIVAGTAVLTYQGVTLTTAERQLINVSPLTAGTQEFNWTITLPPILGGILLAAGVVLVFVIAVVKRSPGTKRIRDWLQDLN